MGVEATGQIQQQITSIQEQFNNLLSDALKAGEAVVEMKRMVKNGEATHKSFEDFITEVRNKIGGR